MARKPQTRWNRFTTAMSSQTAQKWSHRSPALIVAGVALYVSYWHIRQGSIDHGYDLVGASILPLSVDGMLIVSARYVTRAKTILAKIIAALGFVLGMLATLAGNLLTSDGTVIGTGFATWPAVAVIVTAVVLHLGEAKPKPKTASKPSTRATSNRKPTIPTPTTPADSIKPTATTAA